MIDFRSISKVDFRSIRRPTQREGQVPATSPPPATSPKDGGKPGRTKKVRVDRRRMRGLRRAADILDSLPSEGESLHCILYGYFDLASILIALLDKLACRCSHLRVATLSLSLKNVKELCQLLDNGTVKQLDVLTSDFQAKHDQPIFTALLEEVTGKRHQKVGAGRNHCKLLLLDMDNGSRWTLEGSANLRTSRNSENLAISQDAALHDFYSTWFDEVMSKNLVSTEVSDR